MRARILIFDSQPDAHGDVFDPAGVEVPADEVPVALDYRDDLAAVVGFAKLEKAADGLYADIRFLRPVAGYPGVKGVVLERGPGDAGVIRRCRINGVGVGTGNVDPRIERLSYLPETEP